MLPLSLVREIERLLAEGQLSRRKIAARVGVSKSSVASIASGKRGNWGRESRTVRLETPTVARCRSCGAKVAFPCVACRARQYQQRRRRPAPSLPLATGQANTLAIATTIVTDCHVT